LIRLRSAIAALPVYTAGKPAPVMDRTHSFKLSSNENPFPPLPGVIEATAAAVAQMNRYPDIANTQMTSALSSRLCVPGEQLAFGTGSVAVLYHLLQAACEAGDEVVYPWRSFEAYPIAVS
jgi:histidinol-phosphate aminotransferase